MKTPSWCLLTLPVLLLLVAILVWQYITHYQSSSLYTCAQSEKWQLSPPYLPLIGEFLFVDSLQVFLGGWIGRGTLTIDGDIMRQPITFTAGDRPATVSYARIGEWYEPDFQVRFEPSESASCAIRVVYRYRGIF